MRRVKSVGTKPELFFRTLLESKLATSTLDDPERRQTLPGKPDFYFLPQNLAVFIDGDFWHGRQWWKRGFASLEEHLLPRANSAYWIKKIRSNLARDRKVTRSLLNQGVHVLRFWESDLKHSPEECLKLTVRTLKAARDSSRQRKSDAIRRRALNIEENNLRTVDLSSGKWGSASDLSPPQLSSRTESSPKAICLSRSEMFFYILIILLNHERSQIHTDNFQSRQSIKAALCAFVCRLMKERI